ncbi:uncharacterized protein BDZ83DRAFT_103871 [Colletotrichum acutatum]|uniref:Zn(2)-C6 fungal-type domain-containing protein n=1 Tax=Glomerella acutata TaxID=27357 RepID=A0AAD9CYM3_GLOAC|nr:uncharacterized protein BDZ83DRAFT_103871 [Colletotrichum acutatum]KAK1728842.1 hypothetical protein BDZ83DRAFT_103871 [Colletotrichum acutatum]
MSGGSQQQRTSRNAARAERTTTSCGECRRRKQKCDQGQPCSNCLRRFPHPVCEYRVGNRIPGTSTFLTPARAGGRGPLLSTLPGVSSPLIQTSQSIRPLGSPSIAGWAVSGLSTSQPSPSSELATFQSTIGVQRPDAELLNNDAECLPPSVSWLPLANPDRSILDVDIFQASQQVLSHRLAVPKLIFENFETAHDDDNTPQHGQSSGPWSHPAESRVQFPERPASGIDEQIALLPVDQNPLNKKLLRLYIAVLSRFKASINGDPSPNNPFIRHYSPFCLQDPLVMQIILYTSACFLHETGDVRTDVLRICKGQAIAMLNENLTMDSSKSRASNTPALTSTDANRSSTSVFQKPGDAAIAGVIQLTVAEWYWGESDQDLRYHLMGLRDMIRVRGGFNQLGMDGLLAKNAIVCVDLFCCPNICMFSGLTLLRLLIIPLMVDICLCHVLITATPEFASLYVLYILLSVLLLRPLVCFSDIFLVRSIFRPIYHVFICPSDPLWSYFRSRP